LDRIAAAVVSSSCIEAASMRHGPNGRTVSVRRLRFSVAIRRWRVWPAHRPKPGKTSGNSSARFTSGPLSPRNHPQPSRRVQSRTLSAHFGHAPSAIHTRQAAACDVPAAVSRRTVLTPWFDVSSDSCRMPDPLIGQNQPACLHLGHQPAAADADCRVNASRVMRHSRRMYTA